MPNYNPNSIWESKEKEYVYEPAGSSPTPPDNNKPLGSPVQTPDEGPSFFHRHRLLFFSISLLLGLGLIGLVVYLLLPAPTPNVVISFAEPPSIEVGMPFPLVITVSNESKNVLTNAELNITLPAGVYFVGEPTTTSVMSQTIGTLSSATVEPPQNINIIVTGNPGTVEHIAASLTYNTQTNGNDEFQSNGQTDISSMPGQAAMSLNPSAASSIYTGQDFDVVVAYQNNTSSTLQGVQLQMNFPPAYTFSKSTMLAAYINNNTWNLGTLAPNATGSIIITGNIVGPQQAQYQLTGTLSANFSGQNYSITSGVENLTVSASPLSLSVGVNNSSSYISKTGDNLNYVLTYTNNSNVAFQTINLSATLAGQMFDFASLKTQGSFNSNNDTITWYTANTPSLISLAPGQSGSVDFSVSTQSAFPPSGTNYLLNVAAQITSPTVPSNTAGTSTLSTASISTEVGGQIALTAKGYYKDPKLGAVNAGPYPPKVGQATQYTVHWDVANAATNASSVTVSAYLQSGTTFTGVVTSTIPSSVPTYNAATGLVTWTIPALAANTNAEAIFQVSNTPAVNEVGQSVTFIGPTTLTATDGFTGNALQSSDGAITTSLPDDPSVSVVGTKTVTQ